MSQLTPPYRLIREKLLQGQVIPFLGSGASLGGRQTSAVWDGPPAAYLPTAPELACYLARKIEFPKDEPRDLAKVAQYYSVAGGPDTLHQELHDIFARDYPLTSLHLYLADVAVPLLIVTTNYDDLIERALSSKGRAYDLVVHTTDPTKGDFILWWPYGESEPEDVIPNSLVVDPRVRTVIYKMHGAVDRVDRARDQYVITEDDYIDFLARMTRNTAVPAVFADAFQTRHFLFLGYGLRDWNLRVVLNRVEKDLRRRRGIRSWAIQYKPSALEQRFWQERGVEVYDIAIEEFVNKVTSA